MRAWSFALAALLCGGTGDAQQAAKPKVSLVVGVISGLTEIGVHPDCRDMEAQDLCIGALYEARFRYVRTVAGSRLRGDSRIRLPVGEVSFRRRRVALMVWHLDNGVLYSKAWQIVEHGKACFDASWFGPDGVGRVRGSWKDEDGDICIHA